MITHDELIEVCQEIGTVVESNYSFSRGLKHLLVGKSFETLTVAELLSLINQRRVDYNRLYQKQAAL
jgi:hypothetical protein